jgi:hypothetical protein
MNAVVVIGLAAVVFGLIGARIGATKGMEASGFWWGFLLGAVGLVVIACMQPRPATGAGMKHLCQFCGAGLQPDAVICRRCQQWTNVA